MCASTALQTSLKHIFFEEMQKHMNFNCLIIPAGIVAFYNHFGETMKILLQSEPLSLKQLPISPLWQSLFVECESRCSFFREKYIALN